MRRLAAPLSLLAAMLISCLVAPPVAAASPEESAGGKHCVYNLSTSTEQCFATFTQAIGFATGGLVTDAPADPATAAADPTFDQRINAASSATTDPSITSAVLGVSWKDAGYSGASVSWSASSGCDSDADIDWQVSYVGDTWNDIISSAKSYNNCQSKYWQNYKCWGSATSWFTSLSYFGTMNDRASSIQFR
jgi:hypothetical protein